MDAMKLLGSLMNNNATGGNMLGSLLKGVMGGGGASGAQKSSGGGAMGLVGSLLGGGSGGSGGGAAGMIGSLLGGGGGASSGGGAMGMISGLLGGGKKEAATAAPVAPPKAQQDQATILIRAMCNAAKADGEIDEKEQQNIIGRLGSEVDEAEASFLRKELATPLDVQAFARSVPSELAANVYAMSVMTVKVDTRAEVAYLKDLAQGLNLDAGTIGQIHQQLSLK